MLNFISYGDDNESKLHHRIRSLSKFLFVPIMMWSSMNVLIGGMGLIIYMVYSSASMLGPEYVVNQYIGVWMSGMLLCESLQLIYQTCKRPNRKANNVKMSNVKSDRMWLVMNIMYFGVMELLSLIMLIGYGMYAIRVDLILGSLLIVLIGAINVLVVILRWFSNGMYPCDCCYELDEDIDGTISNPLVSKLSVNSNKGYRDERSHGCLRLMGNLCGMVFNLIVRVSCVLIMILLVMGAVTMAGIVNIPMRGQIATVQLEDGSGRFQKIHYICDGPKDSTPTFVFEGDFSHNYADYSDIQKHLTNMGRRSCIYDKPGLGFSDYLFTDQKNASSFYHNFMKSIGERIPYVLVGWGGGGPTIYEYARLHPEMVQSLTFLDVFPDGIEFTSARVLKKLSESQYQELKKKELDSRMNLMNTINSIAVPLGLLQFVIGPTTNTTNANEIAFWMRTEKTWTTQSVFLNQMMTENYTNSVFNHPLPSNISINLVISKHNDSWVMDNNYQCKLEGVDSDDCKYQIELNNYGVQSQLNIVPSLNGGSVTYCTDDDCSQSYYTFINPMYTATTLNRLYPNN